MKNKVSNSGSRSTGAFSFKMSSRSSMEKRGQSIEALVSRSKDVIGNNNGREQWDSCVIS
jgi:hypothetical protein